MAVMGMVLVYLVGHISGAHFNPAITVAFATCKRFPWKQVPPYTLAQVVGSMLASGTPQLLFAGMLGHFIGTRPAGSDVQAFIFEFIITFYLMFIISGIATDNRAYRPIMGASMNPGLVIVFRDYDKLWIYIVALAVGAIFRAWVDNLIRYTDKPIRELTESGSFLRSSNQNCSS